MFIPRKPTPLGIMLKTLVDTASGILLNADIVEGAEEDAKKEYNTQWGKSTGCTLRLCKPWHGKSRIVIGDSWFGSYRTGVALIKHGCFMVMNVKTGHKHFPKNKLKGIVKKRGDTHHVKVVVPGMQDERVNEVYGSIHMDIQPMVLVHTTGLSTPGPSRIRRWGKYKKGKIVKKKYKLDQPHVHSVYRDGYSAVHIFNKMGLGPYSI